METLPVPVISRETTIGRELIAGLVGTAVALGCVMPPLLHLVTGPLGPLIGGLVAAYWIKPGGRGRAIIAVTIGACLASLGALAAAAVVRFGGAPSWLPPPATLALILTGIAFYGSALGALGATLGANFGRGEATTK